jgi:hypothetical protein
MIATCLHQGISKKHVILSEGEPWHVCAPENSPEPKSKDPAHLKNSLEKP